MPDYKGACLSIEGVISRDFAAALECAASVEDKRTIFDTCCAIDEELRTIRYPAAIFRIEIGSGTVININ